MNEWCRCTVTEVGSGTTVDKISLTTPALVVELPLTDVADDGFYFGIVRKRLRARQEDGGPGGIDFVATLLCAAQAGGQTMRIMQEKVRGIDQYHTFRFRQD